MPISVRTLCLPLVLALTALVSSPAALAIQPPSRIVTIAGTSSSPIAHSVQGRAKRATDLGQAPLDHPLGAITLHFARSAAQQAALSQLLADQANPRSPRFRKWLTPAQFKAQFGLSDADVTKTAAWLTAQGFTVTGHSFTNTYLTASGTVAQAQKAFNVSIHTVRAKGETHIANLTDPQLPTGLAGVVAGVTGLSDFVPHPRVLGHLVPKPRFTASNGSHYLAPGDFSTIYDTKPLLASAINGTGATIAVMGQTSISLADVAAFRSAAGLVANVPQVSYNPVNLATSSYDLPEAMLDVEWAGAVAPNASIQFIASSSDNYGAFGSLISSIADTSTQSLAPILSISYGVCEAEVDENFIYTYDSYFQEANAQGQTIVGPGGDAGATDCDDQSVQAADGLSVDFPASSPHATGVGGTNLSEASGSSYWSASNGSDMSSALSYIPEVVWNETAQSGQLAAGGGGRSIFFTKPSWQVGSGVPADTVRDVPDLALNAGAYHDGYLICVTAIDSGGCSDGFADSSGQLYVVGGTSAGTPSFAGVLALVEQKIAQTRGLGNVNPTLYGLGGSTAFHDVTSGTNASICVTGSPDCGSSATPIGYTATVGYDLASGWGSVDANVLAGLWQTATPTGTASTTGAVPSLTSVSLGSDTTTTCGITATSVTFNVTVAAAPLDNSVATTTTGATGTVQLFVDGVANGSAVALVNGAATLTLNTAPLTSGSHKIAVAYSGDSTYASSRGTISPSISPINNSTAYIPVPSSIDVASATAPDFSFTSCQPTLVVAAGGAGTVTMTATSLNGFTGPVTFTASYDGSLGATPSFSPSSVTLTSGGTATTVFTLQAAYQATSSSIRKGAGTPGDSVLAGLSRRRLYGTGAGSAALASLLFLVLPRRRRYIGLLALIVSAGAIGASGCGSGATTIPASGVPPTTVSLTNSSQGYYIVNLTATGTNSSGAPLVHTASLTLTVQ